MTILAVWLPLMVILLSTGLINARWCTRLKSEKQVKTIIEIAQCNQSYEAGCGWFSSAQCTYYEIVECPKERNHTLVRYKIVEECCPGYTLDPINNITCMKTDDDSTSKPGGLPTYSIDLVTALSPSGGDIEGNMTENVSHSAIGNEPPGRVRYYESDDNLLWGLPHGAYAGIACSFIFVCCIVVLVALHVHKKKCNARMKTASENMELEVSEKMISAPHA